MCEICHMTPCHPQCPNAPEPPAVYYCEMDSEFYHEECFEDNAVNILMEECGAMKGVAEEPER